MKFSRYVPITSSAVATTFSIFYVMQGLVSSDEVILNEDPPLIIVDWVQPPDKPFSPKPIDRLPPFVPPVDPPKPVQPKPTDDHKGPTPQISVAPPKPSTDLPVVDLGQVDGERMPIVRVAAQYPRRCAEKGISGWVTMDFDVNKFGSVENPTVIDADPSGCFNRTALKAIVRFKYKPTIIDGQPRASQGVRFRMTFNIEE